ncbi:hypothetical protein M407DRAFT_241599 [Tulasnella calospora MUT 4182]|uniref:Uncharacterized protein n=1 Tax=Tulasnella calospora MUT 4182 TaxID=1051891 RepID=A0A0C3QSQ9_9AGAM|nr:hypothetical protein M407DRAFT_241599 [Tulasnella calospora MUT 4182]
MADSFSEPGLFKGTGPEDCEIFVATIRRRALEQGKQRDNEWIALFASSYLIGDALYWYEGLDEDVQNDWSRLRPALLARFGRSCPPPTAASSTSVISAPAPPTTVPTPAAAPPATTTRPRPLVGKGRLKLLNSDGSLRGYAVKSGDVVDGLYRTWSTGPDDALLISFTTSHADEPFEIQIIDDPKTPQVTDCLAVCWEGLTRDIWESDATFIASSCSFSGITSTKNWNIKKNVWTISNNGELGVDYPKSDGGTERFQPVILHSDDYIYWLRPSRPDTRDFDPVRIVVEYVM